MARGSWQTFQPRLAASVFLASFMGHVAPVHSSVTTTRMLPSSSRRPRIWVDPESGTAPPTRFIGRPLIRWVTWTVFFIVVVLLLGPYVVPPPFNPDFGAHPPPPHIPGHDQYIPHPPPPRPWTRPPSKSQTNSNWAHRASLVRDAFMHAYDSYQKHAFPSDELQPMTGKGINNFNGWGVTLFDSLDTMWIMGLNNTFNDALEVVARSTFVSPAREHFAPFFETVIRYLGGMLSAYALSGETILLSRADNLATLLLPAFNTTSGFPMYAVDTMSGKTRPGWNGPNVLWAEALSHQLEFKYLAHLTGRAEYFEKTEHIMRQMYTPLPGDVYPTMWNIETGRPANNHFSVGAYADSAHEYLLKQWLLTGLSEPQTRDIYLRSMNAVIQNLLYLTPKRNLLYVTDTYGSVPTHTLEHLSCFLPGLLALGVHTLDLSTKERELHSWAADGLARTCWATYVDTDTGLGPDEVQMQPGDWSEGGKGLWVKHVGEWEKNGRKSGVPPGTGPLERVQQPKEREYSSKKKAYLLRPETIESFYILWRTTGEDVWRERGWAVFEAIEKHARREFGYASIGNVDQLPAYHLDEMPSYFLAETLKYLYLLFTDDDILPLNEWVLNTEAHPLPIFNWKKWEKEKYDIPH